MITAPITYCDEDQALVAAYDGLPPGAQLGTCWSDPAFDDLKGRLKTFYIAAQNTCCCYCGRNLKSENHRLWDLEHVTPRAKYAHFMFTPTNLAASCPDCNSMKGAEEVLVSSKRTRKTYPSASEDFQIVHPHFDRFEEHIYWPNNGNVYLPKTEKGRKTIYVCDLLRFAQKYIAWENSAADSSFELEVEAVFNDGSQAAVDAIIAKLPSK